MPRLLLRILLILLLLPPLVATVMGWLVAPSFLHPVRRPLTPGLIREADASFAHSRGRREDFLVTAPDGAELRGWKVRPENPNGSWVLLFHGVADNRVGAIGQSEVLLPAGYSVVMMDQRAHGESGGSMATYGWVERNDTRAVVNAREIPPKDCSIFRARCRHPSRELRRERRLFSRSSFRPRPADPAKRRSAPPRAPSALRAKLRESRRRGARRHEPRAPRHGLRAARTICSDGCG
jgi:hypothetical protein